MPMLDQVGELLVEERQQQTLDMQAINVSVSGNNHLVEFKTANIKHIACSRSQHVNDRANLFVLHNALQISFGNIEWLAFELEHSLELREASLSSTSTGRIALDDEQFSARGI